MNKLLLLITTILLWQSSLEATNIEKNKHVKADIIPSDQLPSSLKPLKELLPGVKEIPNLQLSLPSDFVSIPCSHFTLQPSDVNTFFWGPKEVITKGVKFDNKKLTIKPPTPILLAEVSDFIQQTGPTTFNIEDILKTDPSFTTSKFLWDNCPVLSILHTTEKADYPQLIIGLNCNSKTLIIDLIPQDLEDEQFEKHIRVNAKFWLDFIRGPYGTFTFIDEDPNFLPENLAVLELPKGERKKWKTIHRVITKYDSAVESIPIDQTARNWTELLAVDAIGNFNTEHPDFLDIIINNFQKAVIDQFPGCKTNYKVIEKGEKRFIAERELLEPYGDSPPEYEISAHFVINGTVQRIGYTKRNEKITPEEKKEWISRLKNYASLHSQDEIKKMEDGISLLETH